MDTKKPQYELLFSAKFKKLSPVGYGQNSQLLNWTPCRNPGTHADEVPAYSHPSAEHINNSRRPGPKKTN